MKYQVLARKYRPKSFATMMGQEHVLKALTNALDTERLHHAYLFSGTRGVGKTTVARVLAKALNCEEGITASPCGTCPACKEIDEGRFVDLIEVDAASRTKVEDTRELLENVQYAPTRGRFKIYLIDEVHMLSGHSFNALLKTLEEPPPHVKFLLATTDPQKLPVTILSRCLQFNLKRLTLAQIEQQLQQVLQAEQLDYETAALKPLAIAADGSMRDALSLLDQSIAYSNGRPNLHDVEAMLGCVQKDRIFEIITALANGDGASLIGLSRKLTEQGLDVTTLLAEIINLLQRIALYQQVPEAIDDSLGDQSAIEKMAQSLTAEDVQLYYQIALNGRKDLPYSPLPEGGFEMILLRMLAFRPVNDNTLAIQPPEIETTAVEKKTPERVKKKPEIDLKQTAGKRQKTENNAVQAAVSSSTKRIEQKTQLDPLQTSPATFTDKTVSDKTDEPESTFFDLPPLDVYTHEEIELQVSDQTIPYQSQPPEPEPLNSVQKPAQAVLTETQLAKMLLPAATKSSPGVLQKNLESVSAEQENPATADEQELTDTLADDWHDLINRCHMSGLEQQLAKHCALQSREQKNQQIVFDLQIEAVHMHLLSDKMQQRILEHLQELLKQPVLLNISQCHAKKELNTPQRREKLEAEARQQEAVDSVLNDPRVGLLVDTFDARVIEESIKPV